MGELTRLQHLERLSLPLSVRECEMNMPEVIFVLRDMACLRFLVLSWGRWCNSYDISDGKVRETLLHCSDFFKSSRVLGLLLAPSHSWPLLGGGKSGDP